MTIVPPTYPRPTAVQLGQLGTAMHDLFQVVLAEPTHDESEPSEALLEANGFLCRTLRDVLQAIVAEGADSTDTTTTHHLADGIETAMREAAEDVWATRGLV